MTRRLIAGSMILVAFAALTAAPTGATTNAVVNVIGCSFNGGTVTVPSGVPITLHGNGFAEGNFGLMREFFLKEQTTLTVGDGSTTVYDLSHAWGAPVEFSPRSG